MVSGDRDATEKERLILIWCLVFNPEPHPTLKICDDVPASRSLVQEK